MNASKPILDYWRAEQARMKYAREMQEAQARAIFGDSLLPITEDAYEARLVAKAAYMVTPPKPAATEILCTGPGKTYAVHADVMAWVRDIPARLTRRLFLEENRSELQVRAVDYAQSHRVPLAKAYEAVVSIALKLPKHKKSAEECAAKAQRLYEALFDQP